MTPVPPLSLAIAASAIVGPFVVRSRKGNFGNQDLRSALRMALANRQKPDVEFVEAGTGRRFSSIELIDALDRQDHCPAGGNLPPAPPAAVEPGLESFRNFATSTVDLDLDLDLDLDPQARVAVPVLPPRVLPRSDRLNKASDRRPAVGGGNVMLITTVVLAVIALGSTAYLVLRGG